METALCECGCGVSIPQKDKRDRIRRFVSGHNNRGKFRAGVKGGRQQAQRMYRRLGRCTRCTHAATHRHHRDHDTKNNKRDNIEFLCTSCHAKEHDVFGKWSRSEKNRKENHPKWRGGLTKEKLLSAFDEHRSLRTLERVLHMRRKNIAARLRYYGYKVVRRRASIGRGWHNELGTL